MILSAILLPLAVVNNLNTGAHYIFVRLNSMTKNKKILLINILSQIRLLKVGQQTLQKILLFSFI